VVKPRTRPIFSSFTQRSGTSSNSRSPLFHIIFPPFSIGLASFLAVLNAAWLTPATMHTASCSITGKDPLPWIWHGRRVGPSYYVRTNSDQLVRIQATRPPGLGPLMAYEVLSAVFPRKEWLAFLMAFMLLGVEKVEGQRIAMSPPRWLLAGTL